MDIINQNAKELTALCISVATGELGGGSGDDYGSWAEDIAQDTLIYLMELEMDGKLTEDTVFGLAKTHALFKSKNHRNKEERRGEILHEYGNSINAGLDGSREYLSADPMEIMAYEEMRSRLDELSPKLYNAVERHYIDGRSVTDIAEEDGVSEDVIYKRLQRARDEVTGDE